MSNLPVDQSEPERRGEGARSWLIIVLVCAIAIAIVVATVSLLMGPSICCVFSNIVNSI
jgi:hypothetical protein